MKPASLIAVGLVLFATGHALHSQAAESQRAPRDPRNVGVVALQSTMDSMKIAVTWAHSTPLSRVSAYILEVRTAKWTLADTLIPPVNADTLWVPKDTADVTTAICVRAQYQGGVTGEACAFPPFIIPASPIVSVPGAPVVVPLGGSAGLLDSVYLFVFNDSIHLNESTDVYALGFLTDRSGPVERAAMVTCGIWPDGRRGWVEVVVDTAMRGLAPTAARRMIPDDSCGWVITVDSLLDGTKLLPHGEAYRFDFAVRLEIAVGPDGAIYGVKAWKKDARTGSVLTTEPWPTVAILSGSWGDGSTTPRFCQPTDGDGGCGIGNVIPGTRLRMELMVTDSAGTQWTLAAPVEVIAA